MYTAAVITVSDRCMRGEREDTAGPLVVEMLRGTGYEVVETAIVPDEMDSIETMLKFCTDELGVSLVLTIGGTGFAQRDVTPEATMSVCAKLCPGIAEAMRADSLKKTYRAMFSRGTAGIRRKSLIVNLPGSRKTAESNLAPVLPYLEHGLAILLGANHDRASDD